MSGLDFPMRKPLFVLLPGKPCHEKKFPRNSLSIHAQHERHAPLRHARRVEVQDLLVQVRPVLAEGRASGMSGKTLPAIAALVARNLARVPLRDELSLRDGEPPPGLVVVAAAGVRAPPPDPQTAKFRYPRGSHAAQTAGIRLPAQSSEGGVRTAKGARYKSFVASSAASGEILDSVLAVSYPFDAGFYSQCVEKG